MTATTFTTQRQLMSKNMPADALTGPYAQQQKLLLYVLPVVFAVGGIAFPIGVLFYWTTSNLWTMGQQFYVIRNNPAPGTAAEKAKQDRDRGEGGQAAASTVSPGRGGRAGGRGLRRPPSAAAPAAEEAVPRTAQEVRWATARRQAESRGGAAVSDDAVIDEPPSRSSPSRTSTDGDRAEARRGAVVAGAAARAGGRHRRRLPRGAARHRRPGRRPGHGRRGRPGRGLDRRRGPVPAGRRERARCSTRCRS